MQKHKENSSNNTKTSSGQGLATGRRAFLKSLFSLSGGLSHTSAVQAKQTHTKTMPKHYIAWSDLENNTYSLETRNTDTKSNIDTSALEVHCEPGSVMKIIATIIALEETLISEHFEMHCVGSINIRGKTYTCPQVHGDIMLKDALAKSCNCYFVQLAERISPLTFGKYFSNFQKILGFDKEIDFNKFGSSQMLVLGLAPELAITPSQMLAFVSCLALKGKAPQLNPAPDISSFPKINSQRLSKITLKEHTWEFLKQSMRLCVREGTAKSLNPDDKLKVAAKTGTAVYGNGYRSWVIGFFPVNNPKYAFALFANSGTSKDTAVPLAKDFLQAKNWPLNH